MNERTVIREGVMAGVIGATAVAVWFLVVDMLAGHALYTPQVLGRYALSVLGPAPMPDSALVVVGLYTLLHYAVFVLIGILASAVLRAGERSAPVLAGALILFIAFEVAFYGFTALLSQFDALGTLAWYQIGAANLIAAVLMGAYFWRAHPAVGERLNYALAGRE